MVRDNFRMLERLRERAAERGVTPGQLAIAWVESHPAVTAPIVGASSVEQLEEDAGASAIQLSAEEREELAAPEAT